VQSGRTEPEGREQNSRENLAADGGPEDKHNVEHVKDLQPIKYPAILETGASYLCIKGGVGKVSKGGAGN